MGWSFGWRREGAHSGAPDRFIDQDTPQNMYEIAGLDAKAIVAAGLSALGRDEDASAVIA